MGVVMDYENRYLESGEDIPEAVEETVVEEAEEERYEFPEGSGRHSMIWSVLSLLASVLSVVLCTFYYLALPLSVMGVIFALVSRKSLGYFDKMSLFGIIIGIFGFVFGIFSMIMDLTGMLDKLIGK